MVADPSGRIVAGLVGWIDEDRGDPAARLDAVVVAAASRRHGVGRLLVQGFEARARSFGSDRVVVRTPERNLVFQLFLRSLGFRYVSEVRSSGTYRLEHRI